MHVYGCKISYYTGKVETYLRYRSIPYDYSPTVGNERKLIEGAGVVQMPVVQHTDGRWMTDSTPILAALEAEQSEPTIYPDDPALRFVALLIDDYADEWLWRPAMHYRWSYTADRRYAAQSLYEDLIKDNRPLPAILARRFLTRRQLGNFVKGDGVTPDTWDHVEGAYLNALDLLQAIFEKRPFILGETPTIADFGMMAPMLAHDDRGGVTALGSGGSNRIRSALLQAVILLARGAHAEQAVMHPRMHVEGTRTDTSTPTKLSFEEGWPDAERDAMSKEFDIFEPWDDPNMFFGGVHIASRDASGTMEGAGDPRRAGVFLRV